MAHISFEQSGVGARYSSIDDNHDLVIELDDVAYVKAEQVLFNPDTKALHAVMHEGVFFIGTVPTECAERICKEREVYLSAQHYSGAALRLKADVVITH